MESYDYRIPTANSSSRYVQSHRDVEAQKAVALEQCLKDKRLAEQLAGRSSVVVNVPRSSHRYTGLIPLQDEPALDQSCSPPAASKKSTKRSPATSNRVAPKPSASRTCTSKFPEGCESRAVSAKSSSERTGAGTCVEKHVVDKYLAFCSADLFPGAVHIPPPIKTKSQQSATTLCTVAPPATTAFDLYKALHPA
ncbi:uncharacterized protein LOC135811405 [Sycon ciliatum]|uniref:uncharacterized protein LOC135811405 n=1 Tax=Sycon ciliatum TaxID=27933 RepID=UPI0031F693B0